MNALIWNCRGAGGQSFSSMVKDYCRMYHLDFVAILEPRISGSRAGEVIRRMGLIEGARVEAQGFAEGGGIWCLWRPSCPLIRVVSTSTFCIHMKVNEHLPSF